MNWDDVKNKKLKPPIVPSKKETLTDMVEEDSNPYMLLDKNFEKKVLEREICLFQNVTKAKEH